jgi:hypothetical protein
MTRSTSPEIDLGGFDKIHSGGSSDSYSLRSILDLKVHMGVKREEFFKFLLNKRSDELLTGARVFVARKDEERVEPSGGRIKGLPGNIDPTKQPKNFRDAMSREDRQEWAEAYDAEHQGFYEHRILKIARQEPDAKILGTTTRTEYKTVHGQFTEHKVRLCVMGNQQKQGVHYQLGELYAPVMKAAEVRLFMAIAAKHGLTVFKSDNKQAFLNGEIRDEKIIIRAPDWWLLARA